ncbi:MAG: hypothetical protein SFU27_05075 [Thermonemataceae bacterium]|nr:hypothetical protein [Thermonemataceae bacterium]
MYKESYSSQNSLAIFSALVGLTVLSLVVFGVLRWTNLPTGDFLDWLVGIIGFWWLILVTTIPWNMHFRAKEVLADIANYKNKGQNIEEKDRNYARKIARTYLIVAILLHIISAIILYYLAVYEISKVGYWGAILALLLTGLRPTVRLLQYIHYRLYAISQSIKYPENDIFALQQDIEQIKYDLQQVNDMLQSENPESWISQKEKQLNRLEESNYELRKQNEQFKLQQEQIFGQFSQKTEQRIAQISEDGQFLSQVRELIRFIKNA